MGLTEQMLHLLLLQDAENGLAVGRVVEVGAGEQVVHKILHLCVVEHRAVRQGGMASHA